MTEPFGSVRATAPLTPLFKAAAATYCDGFLFRAVAGKTETALLGLKYAKRYQSQSAGAFTPKIDRSPMLGVFLIFQPRSTLCKALKKILPTTDSLSHGTADPSPAGGCPFDTHVGNDTAQGGTGRHQDLQPPGMSGQRPRFDAARPPLFQMPCEKAFYGCLAHPITDQRYSPHPHGKRAEKASFFIPTNRHRRKRCDKKEVIE